MENEERILEYRQSINFWKFLKRAVIESPEPLIKNVLIDIDEALKDDIKEVNKIVGG